MAIQSQIQEMSRIYKILAEYRDQLKKKQAEMILTEKVTKPKTLSQCPETVRI